MEEAALCTTWASIKKAKPLPQFGRGFSCVMGT